MRQPACRGTGIVKSSSSSALSRTSFDEVALLGANRRVASEIKVGVDAATLKLADYSRMPPASSTVYNVKPSSGVGKSGLPKPYTRTFRVDPAVSVPLLSW